MIRKPLLALLALLAIAGATQAQAQTPEPQGRLTLVSNRPYSFADVTAASSVYYPCAVGNAVRINGTNRTIPSCQLTLTLTAGNHINNSVYDIALVWDGANAQICTGPAWIYQATITTTIASPAVVTWTGHGLKEGDPVVFTTTGALPTGITAGTAYYVGRSPATDTFNLATTIQNGSAGTFVSTSGSQSGTHTGTNRTRDRGTGAGTTELVMGSDGLWTNAQSWANCYNGASNYGPVPANEGLAVGSAFITADGQTEMTFAPAPVAGGTNNKLSVCNLYQTKPMRAMSIDGTGGWTYAALQFRPANGGHATGGVNNRISWLDCWPSGGKQVTASYNVGAQAGSAGSNCIHVGVNVNNTRDTPPGFAGWRWAGTLNNDEQLPAGTATINFGWNYVQAMESRGCGTGTITFNSVANSAYRQVLSIFYSN